MTIRFSAGRPVPLPGDWSLFVVCDLDGKTASLHLTADAEITSMVDVTDMERFIRAASGQPRMLVTDWKVLHRPDPNPVVVKWHTDDIASLHIGNLEIPLTHDELGHAGLTAALQIVAELSRAMGFTVTTEDTPGV